MERKIYVTYNTVTTAHFCNYYYWRGLDCRVTLCCPDFWWFSHNFSSVVLCFVANIDEFHLSIFCTSFCFITWLVFNIFSLYSKYFLQRYWPGGGGAVGDAPPPHPGEGSARTQDCRPGGHQGQYTIYKYLCIISIVSIMYPYLGSWQGECTYHQADG